MGAASLRPARSVDVRSESSRRCWLLAGPEACRRLLAEPAVHVLSASSEGGESEGLRLWFVLLESMEAEGGEVVLWRVSLLPASLLA